MNMRVESFNLIVHLLWSDTELIKEIILSHMVDRLNRHFQRTVLQTPKYYNHMKLAWIDQEESKEVFNNHIDALRCVDWG